MITHWQKVEKKKTVKRARSPLHTQRTLALPDGVFGVTQLQSVFLGVNHYPDN